MNQASPLTDSELDKCLMSDATHEEAPIQDRSGYCLLAEPMDPQPNNPLHGITLEKLLNELVTHYGWHELGRQIDIRCFTHDPSITSSLRFLRRTPWARVRVELLYADMLTYGKNST